MKTTRYLIFAIIYMLLISGKALSQGNNNIPNYIISPGHSDMLKKVIRNNAQINNGSTGDYCHTLNGDTITFVNNGNSMIGYQVSPDMSVPNANNDIKECEGDPSIEIDPGNKYLIFTAGTATINGPVNGIDQQFGSFNNSTWSWNGGIFNPPSYAEGISWFNPAVRIYKSDSIIIYYTGNQMVYQYDFNGDTWWGFGQGITYSTDHGANWTNKMIQLANAEYDPTFYTYFLVNNHLAVDTNSKSPYRGRVYSAWTVSGTSEVISAYKWNGGSNPPFGQIGFKYSLDGMTWNPYATPLIISDSAKPNDTAMNFGVNLQTGNNGEVYAVWAMYGSNAGNDYQPPYGHEFALAFTKSLDGGQSFDPAHKIISNIRGINDDEDFFNPHEFIGSSFPSMCVDHSIVHPGRIYVAWANRGAPGIDTGNYTDIYVFHSDNNGSSWSTPVMIDTYIWQNLTGQIKFSVFPWITCDNETGKVCVVFYDDRNYRTLDQDPRFDTYVSMSKDGGATWEESHTIHINSFSQMEWGGINDSSFCSVPVPPSYAFFSHYNGISVRDGVAYPIWTTNTLHDLPGDTASHPYTTMSPYYIWNCIPDTVLYHYDLLNQDVRKFECQNYISTYDSVIISSGSFSFFDAGDSITLHPDFHADEGSNFHAYIDGCEPFDASINSYRYFSTNGSTPSNIYKTYLYDKLIKVYPNPTSGKFTVELGEFPGYDAKLILLNSMNETLLEITPSSQTSYYLDLSTYPKGIYFVKLFTKDRTYVNKVIYE